MRAPYAYHWEYTILACISLLYVYLPNQISLYGSAFILNGLIYTREEGGGGGGGYHGSKYSSSFSLSC